MRWVSMGGHQKKLCIISVLTDNIYGFILFQFEILSVCVCASEKGDIDFISAWYMHCVRERASAKLDSEYYKEQI